MTDSIELDSKLKKRATLLSLTVAISIVAMKIFAWFVTDSLSLLSSLFDSILDILSSGISFFAIRYALLPADEDHRFGHGKAEDIAAFAQSAFVAGSGLFIIIESIHRLFNPQEVTNETTGIVVMVIASLLTLVLLSYQGHVIKKTNSSVIKADSLHYKTDLLVNFVVIMSLFITANIGLFFIDSLLAFVIAGYILKSSWTIGKSAFDKLMDKEFPDKDRKNIIDIVLSHKEVKGIHDLRTRSSGAVPFIQFHLELDGEITLRKAHDISDEIEGNILKKFKTAEVLIHQDPEEIVDVELQKGRAVPVSKKDK